MKKINETVANQSGTMEFRNHFKNEASPAKPLEQGKFKNILI